MKNKQIAVALIISLFMQMLINIIIPIKSMAVEDVVTIQCVDNNFYNALIAQLGGKINTQSAENKTITMTRDNINSVTELTITDSGSQIQDITGIENFTSLTKLDLQKNQISNLEKLKELKSLTELNLSFNQISDIQSLSGLTGLTNLDIQNNGINNLNPLAQLTNLQNLNLNYNAISNIEPLGTLSRLKVLHIDHNQISDIQPLSRLSGLNELSLNENKIEEIDALGSLTSLTTLKLDNNNIGDISPISGISSLNTFSIKNNEIFEDIQKQSGARQIDLPQIIQATRDSSSKVYTAEALIYEGCTSSDNTKINVDSNTSSNISVSVKGGNADGTIFKVRLMDEDAPVLMATYSINQNTKTNQDVEVTILSNKELQEDEYLQELKERGWNLSEGKTILKKLFTQNTSEPEIVKVRDFIGNEGSIEISVINIDKDPPVLTISKEPDSLTSQEVVVTITSTEEIQDDVAGWTIGADKKTLTKTYNKNGSETVTVKDLAGNPATAEVSVNNIDKEGPVLTITYSVNQGIKTNQSVLVTITANKEIQDNVPGWTRGEDKQTLTKTYDQNTEGEEKITVTDTLGNESIATISVQNIDKVVPTVTSKDYSTENPTNQRVTVTLTLSEEVQVPLGWIQGKENNIIYKDYDANVENEEVVIKDLAGNEVKETITIQNIDKTAPVLDVQYSEQGPTNQNVTVTITSNEEILDESIYANNNWTLSEGKKELTKVFSQNTSKPEIVTVTDLAGNTTSVDISVTNIDKNPPVVKVTYEPSRLTNNNVKVTITANEKLLQVTGWTLEQDRKTLTKEYSENKSETITVTDLAGNTAQAEVVVNMIDKIAPKVTVKYSTEKITNQDVVVTIVSDKELQEVTGWTLEQDGKTLTKKYSENKNEEVVIKDLAGNEIKVQIAVQNIDKNPPEIKYTYNNIDNRIRVTLTSNEELQGLDGWILDETKKVLYKEYDTNKEEIITVKDLAGNETKVQIKVTGIQLDNNGNNGTNNNNNNNNNDNNTGYTQSGREDNSRSSNDLPKTGQNVLILIIGISSIIAAVTFIKYRKYKDI